MPDVWPEALQVLTRCIAEGAQVVDERVGPDVCNLLRVPWDRDPPCLRRPADRKVAEPAFNEAARLVVAELRQDEVRPLVIELEQPVLICREPEEVVLLLEPLGGPLVDGANAVDELGFGLELLAAEAIEPRVDVLVNIAVVVDALQELLHETRMTLVACADEEVIGRVQTPGQLLPGARDPVGVLLGSETLLRGHALRIRSTGLRTAMCRSRCRRFGRPSTVQWIDHTGVGCGQLSLWRDDRVEPDWAPVSDGRRKRLDHRSCPGRDSRRVDCRGR